MEINGHYFSSNMIERIRQTIETEPNISRQELSRRVCQWMDWRAANGKFQLMSCRKALNELNRRGVIALPKINIDYAFQHPKEKIDDELLSKLPKVRCSLAELGRIEIIPVSTRYSKNSKIWNTLMKKFHYLGPGPLCGAQIRYLVRSSEYGWIGALSFSAATKRLKARDTWIGWNQAARQVHLQEVVCNSRFLILPTVQVPNLASHVLSQCLDRLPDDWQKRYGYRPVLVETFVNPQRFRGTCYRAANFIYLGKTAARTNSYPNGKHTDGAKDIYVYPLVDNCKAVLCAVPERPLGFRPRPENPTDWVEEEFGTVELYDHRLKDRLFSLARDFFARPGALVPAAVGGLVAKTKAAYRFFGNPEVTMNKLLKSHIEATVERVRKERVVLAVQDTTTLNYTPHPATEGLGPINTKAGDSLGLVLHDTMAFSVDGTPLGLLDVQCWARDPQEAGKREKRKELPLEMKESMKWIKSYRAVVEVQRLCPETMLVSVADREGDLYELFWEAEQEPSVPKVLIRAERTRNRTVGQGLLWERMKQEPIVGYQEVFIPRKGGRPARHAKLAISYARVEIAPPRKKDLPSVVVWVVYAREVDYSSQVKEPLEWMLITTVETESFEDACERVRWYARRAGIEVYHRTLKSGCRIEDRRLGSADRLEACLAIDMVVAWRVYYLTKQGRETPDIPCDVFLSEDEWQVLYACVRKESPPKEPPSLREAVRMIAKLGGFLGRKSDGEPGTTTIWRGLERLADITTGYVLGKAGKPLWLSVDFPCGLKYR